MVLPRLSAQHHRFRPNSEFRKDLHWWKGCLDVFNGVSLFPDSTWTDPDGLMSTDACLTGGGGWIDGEFFRFRFPESILQAGHHINTLELWVILIGVKIWANRLALKRVTVLCDNSASVFALNSGRTRDKAMLQILREIAYVCAGVNCQIKAVHLPGVNNRKADKLSRSHLNPGVDVGTFIDSSWKEIHISQSLFEFHNNW